MARRPIETTPKKSRKESPGKSASRPSLNPERILQLGLGFMASKTLLTAEELGVFTELAERPLASSELQRRLQLHPTSVHEADVFLDKRKPSYIGGILVGPDSMVVGIK